MGAGIELSEEGDDIVNIGVDEAFEGVVSCAATIEAIMDFGAAGGGSLIRGLAVGKAGKDIRVWCHRVEDRCDDLAGAGAKMAGGVRIFGIERVDGAAPTSV